MRGYLIDTNVLSELRKARGKASPRVLDWWSQLRQEPVFLSVLVLGEIRRGIALLSVRDRASADNLERWLEKTRTEYAGKILSVNVEVALRWGLLTAIRPLPMVDGLLAATALEYDLTLVTRNEDDFHGLGIRIFNPFL